MNYYYGEHRFTDIQEINNEIIITIDYGDRYRQGDPLGKGIAERIKIVADNQSPTSFKELTDAVNQTVQQDFDNEARRDVHEYLKNSEINQMWKKTHGESKRVAQSGLPIKLTSTETDHFTRESVEYVANGILEELEDNNEVESSIYKTLCRIINH